jgi:branched-chain amino acid transport system substrate-binding protein
MEKQWRRRRVRGLCAGIVVGMAALLGPAARAADPYDLDVILPLTGGGAFLGQAEHRSLQILEKLVNGEGGIAGRPLRFVFYDDQTSPQVAVQLAAQVIAKRPAVVIGSALVGLCNAMAPLMKNGPVMYCLSPGIHPPAGSHVFTSTIATRDGGAAMARYFGARGWKRLAFIFSTDATGKEAEEDFEAVLARPENKDLVAVAREHFTPGSVSAAAQIEHVKAAQPDVFFAWSTGAPVAVLFKGIIQTGLQVPIATTNGNMTYQQMSQYADFLPKQLYLPSSVWLAQAQGLSIAPGVDEAQRRFFAAYKAADVEPDSPATLPWDPAMIIVDGLRKLGPQATAAELDDYIAHLKGYAGIQGSYDFEKTPQRGLDVSDAVVTQWAPAQKRWTIVSQPAGAPLSNKAH